ncbi:GntR family transcriptional regulator [Mycobacterium sp. NPDC003449]
MIDERVDFAQCFRPVAAASGIPLYSQIVQQVEDALRRRVIRPGQFLPPEPELCAGFDVARTTLRRAAGQLIDRGVLRRVPGVGTQISQAPSIDYSSLTSPSLYSDLKSAHRDPATRVISMWPVTADGALSRRTGFPVGTELVAIDRLRLAASTPIAVLGNHLPAPLADFESQRLVDNSLDAVLRGRGHHTRRIEYEVSAWQATAHEARLLDIAEGTPLLREQRWAYDAGGTYMNFSENYYHPTHFHMRGVLLEDPPGDEPNRAEAADQRRRS